MAALFITLLALLCSTNVLARPDGAPTAACFDMTPQHRDTEPQTGVAPYTLTLSTDQYDPNSEIIVTLEADQGETFKGFFIQVKTPDAPNDEADLHGSFEGPEEHARNECLDEQFGDGNAITHTHNETKTSITVVWTAPPDIRGDLQFRVSIVKERVTWWPQLHADIIRPSSSKKIKTIIEDAQEKALN